MSGVQSRSAETARVIRRLTQRRLLTRPAAYSLELARPQQLRGFDRSLYGERDGRRYSTLALHNERSKAAGPYWGLLCLATFALSVLTISLLRDRQTVLAGNDCSQSELHQFVSRVHPFSCTECRSPAPLRNVLHELAYLHERYEPCPQEQ